MFRSPEILGLDSLADSCGRSAHLKKENRRVTLRFLMFKCLVERRYSAERKVCGCLCGSVQCIVLVYAGLKQEPLLTSKFQRPYIYPNSYTLSYPVSFHGVIVSVETGACQFPKSLTNIR